MPCFGFGARLGALSEADRCGNIKPFRPGAKRQLEPGQHIVTKIA
jgi:hypothetical protein